MTRCIKLAIVQVENQENFTAIFLENDLEKRITNTETYSVKQLGRFTAGRQAIQLRRRSS